MENNRNHSAEEMFLLRPSVDCHADLAEFRALWAGHQGIKREWSYR